MSYEMSCYGGIALKGTGESVEKSMCVCREGDKLLNINLVFVLCLRICTFPNTWANTLPKCVTQKNSKEKSARERTCTRIKNHQFAMVGWFYEHEILNCKYLVFEKKKWMGRRKYKWKCPDEKKIPLLISSFL